MDKVLICGFGLIGKQRLEAILKFGFLMEQIFIYDPELEKINGRTNKDLNFISSIGDAFKLCPKFIVISAPHDSAVQIARELSSLPAKVLMEKPMGRTLQEATELKELYKNKDFSIGFNYRHMIGVQKLKAVIDSGKLGKISSIKIELGHGGSPSDLKSWKLDLVKSGGGALLDPGIHAIDLALYLCNSVAASYELIGITKWGGFWQTGIEESVNVLGYLNGIPLNIIVSLVAWRTRFSVEINGIDEYIFLEGRGRTDGPQIVTTGPRWGWQNESSQKASEKSKIVMEKDTSIIDETIKWLSDSSNVADLESGYQSMLMYHEIQRKMANDKI